MIREQRVRYLSFLGIAQDDNYCGYILESGGRQGEKHFMFYGFRMEPNTDRFCLALHSACQARYKRVLESEARTQGDGATHPGKLEVSWTGWQSQYLISFLPPSLSPSLPCSVCLSGCYRGQEVQWLSVWKAGQPQEEQESSSGGDKDLPGALPGLPGRQQGGRAGDSQACGGGASMCVCIACAHVTGTVVGAGTGRGPPCQRASAGGV